MKIYFILLFISSISCDQGLEKYLWPLKDSVISFLDSSKADLSLNCQNGLKLFSNGLKTRQKWAFKMLDSWGKMPSGFFSGKYVELGHFKQCLGIKEDEFVGQFSLINIHWPLPERRNIPHDVVINLNNTSARGTWLKPLADVHVQFYFENFISAVCYPSMCSREDIDSLFQVINNQTYFKVETKSAININSDVVIGNLLLKKISIVTICLLVSITAFSSFMSYFYPQIRIPKILKNFDAIDAWAKVNAPYFSEAGKRMAFMNGIRAHYLILAITAHLFMPICPKILGLYLEENHYYSKNRFWAAFARISGTQVAMSFVMGGALAYYGWNDFMNKTKGKIPFVIYVLVRWLRTLPVIVACLMMVFAVPFSFTAGPLFESQLRNSTENCLDFGWADLLGLSNKMKASEVCIPHAWYLSADFQFYVMSYFLVLLFYRNAMLAIKISVAIIFGSTIALGLSLKGPIIGFPGEIDMRTMGDMVPWILFSNYQHVGSYITGLLLGYFMTRDIRINSFVLPFIWFAVIQFHSLTQIVPMLAMTMPETLPEPWETVLQPLLAYLRSNPQILWWFRTIISSSMKQSYSVAFALICYLLYHEKDLHEEAPNFFMMSVRSACRYLSSNFFAPFGRMSYSLFMVHFFIVMYMMSAVHDAPTINPQDMLIKSCFVTVLTGVLGVLMYLCVEAPFISLLKSLAGKSKSE